MDFSFEETCVQHPRIRCAEQQQQQQGGCVFLFLLDHDVRYPLLFFPIDADSSNVCYDSFLHSTSSLMLHYRDTTPRNHNPCAFQGVAY